MTASIAAVGWPVLDRFRLGDSFAISPHGLGIAVGFLLGGWVLTRQAARRGVSEEDSTSMLMWAVLGAILGARLFYVIAHFSEFDGVLDMLAVWRGGISLLGGIAGAILINVPKMRRHRYRFFQVMDGAVIGLAFGIAVGRIGDLIIGDHLGKPTSWLLAWTYDGGTLSAPFDCVKEVCTATLQGGNIETITRTGAKLVDASGHLLATGVGVHQTALYDMISAALLFAVLWAFNRRPRREGVITLVFGAWYGLMRVLEDSLRIDKRFFGLTGSQWTGLTVATLSILTLIVWALRSKRRAGTDPGALA